MKLSELLSDVGITCTAEQGEIEITKITCNSKRVVPGALFVCLPGTKTNGAEFICEAKAAGAAAVLCDREEGNGVIVCHDTLWAMSVLCRKMYGHGIDRLKLIAVTGTNGKTSTVRFLESIFTAAGIRCGTVGTLGCHSSRKQISISPADVNANMTTPDPEELYTALSQMSDDGDEYVFIEASSHALARKKLDALHFEAGIFTNLTREHLDYHKTFEEYASAKARLPQMCDRFILNLDDRLHRLICPDGSISCSERRSADFRAECVELYGKNGCAYRLVSRDHIFPIRSRLSGNFTVMNTLEAAACALSLGIAPFYVQTGIAALNCVSGRMEKVALSSNANISVYIDYAHTPDALENALKSAKKIAEGGRVVVVFGCGGDRDRGKRSEMGRMATRLADFTVITSDNSRSEDPEKIINDILVGVNENADYKVITDRKSAIEYAIKESRPDDVILIAGKGHEKYEIDSTGKHPFDEIQIVRKIWLEK